MFHRQAAGRRRSRVSYANVTATVALFLAMGGGTAWAATHHYLIFSTHQIKPSVLRELRGHNGKNGANGKNGTNGKNGAAAKVGAQGKTGSIGKTGPTGKTGVTGAPGANGAAAGFSASNVGPVDFSSSSAASPTAVLSKSLPAGNFIVTAKTSLSYASTTTGAYIDAPCRISDGSATDTALWNQTVTGEQHNSSFQTQGTESLSIAVSGGASTVNLVCWVAADSGASPSALAEYAQIDALQTATNG